MSGLLPVVALRTPNHSFSFIVDCSCRDQYDNQQTQIGHTKVNSRTNINNQLVLQGNNSPGVGKTTTTTTKMTSEKRKRKNRRKITPDSLTLKNRCTQDPDERELTRFVVYQEMIEQFCLEPKTRMRNLKNVCLVYALKCAFRSVLLCGSKNEVNKKNEEATKKT